jgi:hypothetical protein
MRSVSYQRNADDYFFPELILVLQIDKPSASEINTGYFRIKCVHIMRRNDRELDELLELHSHFCSLHRLQRVCFP